MANNRILAIITVLLLTGGAAQAQQEPSLDDLLTIDKLITDGDWLALYVFVEANPNLTAGNTALAVELNKFVTEVERGPLNQFDAAQDAAQTDDLQVNIY